MQFRPIKLGFIWLLAVVAISVSVGCEEKQPDEYTYQSYDGDYDYPPPPPPEDDRVHVRAPFVDVRVGWDDRVRVNAPGTDVDTDPDAPYAPYPGPTSTAMAIDHVTVGCRDLEQTQQAFNQIGLSGEYGGVHADGSTEMAMVSFPDGSYLELISEVKGGRSPKHWKKRIRGGVPCAWAVQSYNLDADAARLEARDVKVRGPIPGGRRLPNGNEIQWAIARVGKDDMGATLPYLIEDITPRSMRIQVVLGSASRDLRGVVAVVIGVEKLDKYIEKFQEAYDWPPPAIQDAPDFGATLAYFPGTPVVLATPLSDDNWLDDFIDHYDDGPVAFLIETPSIDSAARRLPLRGNDVWFGRRMAWLETPELGGSFIGLIE